MDLIRRPGKGVVEALGPRSCTLVFLNRCGGLEEPSPVVQERSIGGVRSEWLETVVVGEETPAWRPKFLNSRAVPEEPFATTETGSLWA